MKCKAKQTLISQRFDFQNGEHDKQIKQALKIERIILKFMPKNRRAFFCIGSTVVVDNVNKLDKTPWRIGYIESIMLDTGGLYFIVRLSPFTHRVIQYYRFNDLCHSIKDYAQRKHDYLIGRLKEYSYNLKRTDIDEKTLKKFKTVCTQIKHVLLKSHLLNPFEMPFDILSNLRN